MENERKWCMKPFPIRDGKIIICILLYDVRTAIPFYTLIKLHAFDELAEHCLNLNVRALTHLRTHLFLIGIYH